MNIRRSLSSILFVAVVSFSALIFFCPVQSVSAMPEGHGDCDPAVQTVGTTKAAHTEAPRCMDFHKDLVSAWRTTMSDVVHDMSMFLAAQIVLGSALAALLAALFAIAADGEFTRGKHYLRTLQPIVWRKLTRWFVVLEHEMSLVA